MAGLECSIIWIIKSIPLLSLIVFLYLYYKYFLENADVYKTTLIICIFALTFCGSLYLYPQLEIIYECRKIDQYKEKVINFTYKSYELPEFDWLKEQCNGHPRFHTLSIDENDTIIQERKISYETKDEILALECFPRKGNNIIVWGDCNIVYKYHEFFPKTWYTCNGL